MFQDLELYPLSVCFVAQHCSIYWITIAMVPQMLLYSGAEMPAIGLGTFGSNHVTAAEVAAAVDGSAAVGYRHFDCASVCGNEHEIGYALPQVRSLVGRERIWITSKLWNDKHGETMRAEAERRLRAAMTSADRKQNGSKGSDGNSSRVLGGTIHR